MNEDEFWGSTLRKICALLDIHSKVNSPRKGEHITNNEAKGETISLRCVD